MSVALIAHYLGPRLGIGQYLDRLLLPLVEELKSRGVPFVILGSPNAVEKTPALQKLSNFVQVLEPLDDAPGKRYLWFATKFNGYCRQQGIDAVIWLSNPIVLPWHPPTIATVHDVNEWKAAQKYGDRVKTTLRSLIYLDASFNFAKKVIVVSKATERDVLHFRSSETLKQKLIAIPNGADSQLVHLPPTSVPAPDGPFLLSVGRIDPASKRLPAAVKLVEALRNVSQQPWELHIVGGMNTTTQAAGEAFLKSVESLPWVQYQGHISDEQLAQWYRQATAVVFLSDNEGFGFPIAEAASFGRWAVISDKNQAGMEAGGEALIPIDADNPEQAAAVVLQKLSEGQPQPPKLQSWQETAAGYATEIATLLAK